VRLSLFFASLAALAQNAPTYKVDPFWPKQFLNDCIIRPTISLGWERG